MAPRPTAPAPATVNVAMTTDFLIIRILRLLASPGARESDGTGSTWTSSCYKCRAALVGATSVHEPGRKSPLKQQPYGCHHAQVTRTSRRSVAEVPPNLRNQL